MRIRTFCLVMGVALAAIGIAAADGHHAPQAPSDARLEFLKGLQGSWKGDFGGEMGVQVMEFRVTAGGHAVEEREMVGSPMEMLTVYHVEGADLVGNHYCMLGNRPKVKAAAKVVDNALSFACAGTPGGSKSHDEHHVHGWTMKLDDQGRLHYAAELVQEGKVTSAPTVVLSRTDVAAK